MDARRTPVPPLTRTQRMGQPYHGKLVGNQLTLSTGKKIDWIGGSLFGDCYRLAVPGHELHMTPADIEREALQGREWRGYALLTGLTRNYAGFEMGTQAWLYAAPDGTVWHIKCPQLDGNWLQPTLLYPGVSTAGKYPGSGEFEFHVRRWGVISPDGEDTEPTYVIHVHADFGAELESDPISDVTWPLERRKFQGDGRMVQWCPVNIEDISSHGNKVLFALGRTNNQSVTNATRRGVAQIWLLVNVTGSGEDIAISMAPYRVGRGETATGGAPIVFMTSSQVWRRLPTPDWHWEPFGDTAVPTTTMDYETRADAVCGLYFDSSDGIQTVGLAHSERDVRVDSPSGECTMGGGFEGVGTSVATFLGESTLTVTVKMGPHIYSPPAVSMSVDGVLFNEMSGGVGSTTWSWHMTVTGGVLGDATIAINNGTWTSESGWPAPGGSGVGDYMPQRAFATWEVYLYLGAWEMSGALGLREWDGLGLVRVSNKVYAVVGSLGSGRAGQPGGFKVVAFGTPTGWITGAAISNSIYASYNPGTAEFAHSASPVGWV